MKALTEQRNEMILYTTVRADMTASSLSPADAIVISNDKAILATAGKASQSLQFDTSLRT
jgi:hypothetical protein